MKKCLIALSFVLVISFKAFAQDAPNRPDHRILKFMSVNQLIEWMLEEKKLYQIKEIKGEDSAEDLANYFISITLDDSEGCLDRKLNASCMPFFGGSYQCSMSLTNCDEAPGKKAILFH